MHVMSLQFAKPAGSRSINRKQLRNEPSGELLKADRQPPQLFQSKSALSAHFRFRRPASSCLLDHSFNAWRPAGRTLPTSRSTGSWLSRSASEYMWCIASPPPPTNPAKTQAAGIHCVASGHPGACGTETLNGRTAGHHVQLVKCWVASLSKSSRNSLLGRDGG